MTGKAPSGHKLEETQVSVVQCHTSSTPIEVRLAEHIEKMVYFKDQPTPWRLIQQQKRLYRQEESVIERRPVLMAGKSYGTPWTRDASYNTFFCAGLMYPAIAKNTLKSVLKQVDAEVRIRGQYWDSISWVTGAWEYYLYTDDYKFLALAYEAAVNTLSFFEETKFDSQTGLFCGPGWSDNVAGYPCPLPINKGEQNALCCVRLQHETTKPNKTDTHKTRINRAN